MSADDLLDIMVIGAILESEANDDSDDDDDE